MAARLYSFLINKFEAQLGVESSESSSEPGHTVVALSDGQGFDAPPQSNGLRQVSANARICFVVEIANAERTKDKSWTSQLDNSCDAYLCEVEQCRTGECKVWWINYDDPDDKTLLVAFPPKSDTVRNRVRAGAIPVSCRDRANDSLDDIEPKLQENPNTDRSPEQIRHSDRRTFKFLLIEGYSESIIRTLRNQGLSLPASFHQRHINGIASESERFDFGQALHLKWLRTAVQTVEQWNIGQIIQTKRSSKSHPLFGPKATIICYERSPELYRPYNLLDSRAEIPTNSKHESSRSGESISVVAQQMCSVVLLEPQRTRLAIDGNSPPCVP